MWCASLAGILSFLGMRTSTTLLFCSWRAHAKLVQYTSVTFGIIRIEYDRVMYWFRAEDKYGWWDCDVGILMIIATLGVTSPPRQQGPMAGMSAYGFSVLFQHRPSVLRHRPIGRAPRATLARAGWPVLFQHRPSGPALIPVLWTVLPGASLHTASLHRAIR